VPESTNQRSYTRRVVENGARIVLFDQVVAVSRERGLVLVLERANEELRFAVARIEHAAFVRGGIGLLLEDLDG
jgi:hypothetical protein